MGTLQPLLPNLWEIETRPILKKLARAHRALAELKGVAATIPNETILVETLSLQEAKDSSAIENIVTTHDELYQSDVATRDFVTLAAKEVHAYAAALKGGFWRVRETGLLTNADVLEIQAAIEGNRAGFRKVPGTALKNEQTGETVYVPPQSAQEILELMADLERFINDDEACDWDPLTKMAVIHHQFESIHPFYDGNGRTGRIVNILYLVKSGLLASPVLYLSRYINQHKAEYYRLLQKTRTDGAWEDWVLFMLDGVEVTAQATSRLVVDIRDLMLRIKHKVREELVGIYSQDLINNLFRHPYTKVDFVVRDLKVHRNTASKYLEALVAAGILSKHRIGRENYFVNDALFRLLLGSGHPGDTQKS